MKWGALETANLFIMPSDFENFGMSIAEGLAAGIPVITTKGTPWKVLDEVEAGWWVAPTEKGLAGALNEALELSDRQRMLIGERGKSLSKRFHPKKVTKDLQAVYQWMLGNGPCPEHVRR